jgi:hypothetical protein
LKTIDKIKRLAVRRKLKFTFKAECELLRDGLSQDDVIESIINAPDIKKILKSSASLGDRLYIIESPNLDGLWIYTKGKLMKDETEFYVLISSKLAE